MRDKLFSRVAMTFLIAAAANAAFADKIYKDEAIYKGVTALPCPSLMGGFYLGAQLGYDAYRLGHTITGPGGSFSLDNSLTGWVGGLYLGYGQYFNDQFYLGAEVLGNYNGNNDVIAAGSDDDGDSFSRTYRARGSWGIVVIPGIKLNPASLGYLRLGYIWTDLRQNTTIVNDGGAPISLSNDRTIGGFDFGVGIETLLCANWSVRTQYDHVWYSNKTTSSVDGTSVKLKPSNNQFTVGISYHF